MKDEDMEWTCKKPSAPYDIRDTDRALIQAAIGLGEWIRSHEGITIEQREAASMLIAFLQRLPEPPPRGLNGNYSVEFYAEDDKLEAECVGYWDVSLCRAGLEIINGDREGIWDFSWELCPGEENRNDMAHAQEWIVQVADPLALRLPGTRMKIEAETFRVSDN